MQFSKGEKSLVESLKGLSKTVLSTKYPILAPFFKGYDIYKKYNHDKNSADLIAQLESKVADSNKLFDDEWLKTEDGRIFFNKVIDAALDTQIKEKQELFVNALVNGIKNKEVEEIEKMKFVDILRQVSKLSLMVLHDMYEMFKDKSWNSNNGTFSVSQIMPDRIAEELSNKYDPYAVTAAIDELRSQGLFSNISGWGASVKNGKLRASGSINDGSFLYTEYTHKFVEFVSKINS